MTKAFIAPEIEKNIPLPVKSTVTVERIEFIKKLEIGDSFKMSKQLTSTFQALANKIGYKLVTSVISETEFRVWRVK